MLAICSLALAISFHAPLVASQAGRISGRVTQGPDAPLSAATITLMPEPFAGVAAIKRARSDQQGFYTFENMEPGTYRVEVLPFGAPHYLPAARIVHLGGGVSAERVDLMLPKEGIITGRVFDPDGKPLARVQISVSGRLPPDPGSGPLSFEMTAEHPVTTNERGEFRAEGLAGGDYYVWAMPRRASISQAGSPTRVSESTGRALIPTFFPGTTDRAAAQILSVRAGAEINDVIFAVGSEPAFRVSGVVVDQDGRPVGGESISLIHETRGNQDLDALVGNTRSGADGRFGFDDVPAGTYRAAPESPISTATVAKPEVAPAPNGLSVSVVAGVIGSVGGLVASGSGAGGVPPRVVVVDSDVTNVRLVIRRPAVR